MLDKILEICLSKFQECSKLLQYSLSYTVGLLNVLILSKGSLVSFDQHLLSPRTPLYLQSLSWWHTLCSLSFYEFFRKSHRWGHAVFVSLLSSFTQVITMLEFLVGSQIPSHWIYTPCLYSTICWPTLTLTLSPRDGQWFCNKYWAWECKCVCAH